MKFADSFGSIEKSRVINIEELVGRGGCRSDSRESAAVDSDLRSAAVVDRVRGVTLCFNELGNYESLADELMLLSFSVLKALGGPT